MGMNFQDVIRDVHDPSLHSLKTTASLSASTVYVGNPTLYAVVNTTASSGLATVNINGSATIFAVVNTSAAGVGNSIVTVANPNFGINAGLNNIGFATVAVSTPTLYAVVNTGGANTGNITLNPSPNQIGSVTVSNPITVASSVNNIGFATVAVSTPTIYAVVNTTASSGLATVTLNNGVGNIGFATVSLTNAVGNATLNPSPNFIGLTTTVIGSAPTIFAVVNTAAAGVGNSIVTVANPNFGINTGLNSIGFATVAVSTPTLYAVVNTSAPGITNSIVTVANPNFGIIGNITLSDPKTYIGLTTATLGSMPSVLSSGQYFPAPQSVASGALAPLAVDATGELLLGNTNKYIGLTSVSGVVGLQSSTLNIGSVSILGGVINTNLNAGVAGIGFATVFNATAWPDPKTYIGLVTVANTVPVTGTFWQATQPVSGTVGLGTGTLNIGSVSVLGGTINATLQTSTLNIGSVSILGGSIVNAAGVNGIGFVTAALGPSPQYIGLVTAVPSTTARTITGNLTLSDSKGFIGLVTSVPAYGSNSTVFTGVISATGNTTILVAPASNRFFIKNIHVASLGRAEVEFKSGATTLIPFTSLSTTAGFAEHFGEMGLPARAQTDALVANLNGAATIAYMVNVRFEV